MLAKTTARPVMTPKKLRAAMIILQAQLAGSRRALASGDEEALHSLRVTLRQLTSLLKPLSALPVFSGLYASARDLARQTSPLRDAEVLCAELARIAPALAEQRQQALHEAYLELRQSPALDHCEQAMTDFLAGTVLPDRDTLKSTLSNTLGRWERQLQHALDEQAALEACGGGEPDRPTEEAAELNRHRLRLLIKRLRYTLILWQKPSARSRRLVQALRLAQDSLGDWHDRVVWLERSRAEPELLPFAADWSSEMHAHAAWADYQLSCLGKPLRQWCRRGKAKR